MTDIYRPLSRLYINTGQTNEMVSSGSHVLTESLRRSSALKNHNNVERQCVLVAPSTFNDIFLQVKKKDRELIKKAIKLQANTFPPQFAIEGYESALDMHSDGNDFVDSDFVLQSRRGAIVSIRTAYTFRRLRADMLPEQFLTEKQLEEFVQTMNGLDTRAQQQGLIIPRSRR